MPISSVNTHPLFDNSVRSLSANVRKGEHNESGLAISAQIQKSIDKAKQTANALQKTFDDIKTQGSASRKAAARQRMQLLKQRIDQLQLLSVAHPVSAQEVKRLAQELKGLVAQYAGLNDDGAKINYAPSPSPSFSAQAPLEGDPTASDNTAQAATKASEAASATTETESTQSTAQVKNTATTSSDANKSLLSVDNNKNSFKVLEKEREGDIKFLAEAKQLAARIKLLAQRVKPPTNPAEKDALKQAKKEIEAMDKLFEKATDALGAQHRDAISSVLGGYDAGGSALEASVTQQISLKA